MRAVLKDQLLVLVPETDEEALSVACRKEEWEGHVVRLGKNSGDGLTLVDLGPEADARREPINVTSRAPDESVRLIGNFATAPFELDGQHYRSVESFWQGLKFESAADRRRLASLEGPAARGEGDPKGYGATIKYQGKSIAVGTRDHWDLMERACWAKFTQDEPARAALLATGDRPLVHRVRRDSRTIPGVIMAEIWMKVRGKLNLSPAEEC